MGPRKRVVFTVGLAVAAAGALATVLYAVDVGRADGFLAASLVAVAGVILALVATVLAMTLTIWIVGGKELRGLVRAAKAAKDLESLRGGFRSEDDS